MTKIYYKPKSKEFARQLRNRATQSEIKLWKYLKGKQLDGYDFHRQKPIGDYIKHTPPAPLVRGEKDEVHTSEASSREEGFNRRAGSLGNGSVWA